MPNPSGCTVFRLGQVNRSEREHGHGIHDLSQADASRVFPSMEHFASGTVPRAGGTRVVHVSAIDQQEVSRHV